MPLQDNHHALFPYYVTTIVDCFPLEVLEPVNKETHRLLNQGKYKATVLKGEVVITLTGEIVSFTFPHLGVRGDARIWREQTLQLHQFLPNEWCMGDGAYIACEHCVTKYTVCGF